MKLQILLTQDGLIYRELKGKAAIKSNFLLNSPEHTHFSVEDSLKKCLEPKYFTEIEVISAINHFTVMPTSFSEHEKGLDLISYNSDIDKNNEELMLSINHKYHVQFYFSILKTLYNIIKERDLPTHFNFSGEKFLQSIEVKNRPEIHIHLYHQQCEFFAFNNKKIQLYNNLDLYSEVDFLYFIMFTISKIGFNLEHTHFMVYGEVEENETFVSELKKFSSHIKVKFANTSKKNFILD